VKGECEMQHPPYLQEEHDALRKMLRRFVKNEIEPHVETWEENGAFPRGLLQDMKELGLLGMSCPEELEGLGSDEYSVVLLAEELGRCGSGGLAMALMYHAELALAPLAQLGTPEQVERFFKPAMAGESIVAYGLYDILSNTSGQAPLRAVADGNEWVVDGTLSFVPNGAAADTIVFAAKTGDGEEEKSWTLFVTELARPGIGVGGRRLLAGMRTMETADVAFDQVRLSAGNVLGPVNGAFSSMKRLWQKECLIRSAVCLGLAQCAYEQAKNYAKERQVFQRPLSQFQVPAHLLAEMAVEVEAVRHLVYGAAYRFEQGEEKGKDALLARLAAAQAAHWVADRALQLYGGYGYMMEYPIQRIWRDTKWFRMSGGTDEQLKALFVEQMAC